MLPPDTTSKAITTEKEPVTENQPEPEPEVPPDKEALAEQAVQQLAKLPRTHRELLHGPEFLKGLAEVRPPGLSSARFVRQTLTAMMRNHELADCSRESFFKCLFDLASLGLEPDGRRAHLIPFKNRKTCQCGHEMDSHRGQDCTKCACRQRRPLVECTLIIDYKGIAELVRRSGEVSYIHADVVYENDDWSYGFGTEAHLRHKPNLRNRGAEKVAYYSYVRLKDGCEDFVVMSPAEVDRIRQRSKAADAGPWVTDYDEMGKKTVFRRHSKWLPLSPEVRRAVEDDDEAIDVSSTWNEALDEQQETARLEAAPQPQRRRLRDEMMGTAKGQDK